jgi:predicted transcriptional regulator
MGDNYRRSKTTHTSYRLPPTIKSKLTTIAKVDSTTQTETLKRLINQEYKARQEEIAEFRKSQNNEIQLENSRTNEIN